MNHLLGDERSGRSRQDSRLAKSSPMRRGSLASTGNSRSLDAAGAPTVSAQEWGRKTGKLTRMTVSENGPCGENVCILFGSGWIGARKGSGALALGLLRGYDFLRSAVSCRG